MIELLFALILSLLITWGLTAYIKMSFSRMQTTDEPEAPPSNPNDTL